MDCMKHIARANNVPYTLTQKLDSQLQHTLNSHDRDNDNPNFKTQSTFMYHSPSVRTIKNFSNTRSEKSLQEYKYYTWLYKKRTVMYMNTWKLDLWAHMCHIPIILRWTKQSMLKTKVPGACEICKTKWLSSGIFFTHSR
jgi:hypothetical protein